MTEPLTSGGRDPSTDGIRPSGATYARGVLTTSVSQAIVIALSVATSIIQARLLGTEGRGDVARFVNAGALVVLYFGLGISSSITYFVASRQVRSGAMLAALRPMFVITVLAVFVCLTAAGFSPLERLLPQSLPIGWVITALVAFFALSQVSSWISAVHAARGYFTAINVSSLGAALVAAAASLGLLVFRPAWAGPAAIVGLLVASEAFRAAVLILAVLRGDSTPPLRDSGTVSERLSVAAVLRYSALSFFADAVQFLTYRFDMWVVDAYHGAADLGRYAVAVSFAQLVWIVPSAAARVLFPFTAMMEEAPAAALAWKAAKVTLLIAAALALGGWIVSRLFLTALLGNDFAEVPELLGILLLGVVPFSVAKILGNYLAGRNALGANLASAGLVLALTVVLDLAFIPGLGARGAAWATAVSYIAYTLLLLAIFLRVKPRSSAPSPR